MSSMWKRYLEEKTKDKMLETDKGFATYRYIDEKTVYIIDIYVLPDFRKEKVASLLADTVVEEAKARGCKKLVGSVVPSANNSTMSLKVLLGYGMTLEASTNDFITFRKDI
jgi:ribosomal protein S18 acetylase RimI-like enzyme